MLLSQKSQVSIESARLTVLAPLVSDISVSQTQYQSGIYKLNAPTFYVKSASSRYSGTDISHPVFSRKKLPK